MAIAAVTLVEPLNDVPDSPVPSVKVPVVLAVIVVDPPKLTEFPLIVMLLFAKLAFGIAVLIAEDGIDIVVLDAAVNCPCAFTVIEGTDEAVP